MTSTRIALIVVVTVTAACSAPAPEFFGTDFDPTGPARDFSLTDQNGDPFRLAEHRGKVVLLFFGFVHCPDVCPVTLSNWARAETTLDSPDDVAFVFVTVDPERDTAERLREHLAIFSGGFVGLTGTEERIEPVYERFGIFREKRSLSDSAMGYVVDHSTQIIVLDRRGRLRLTLPFDADPGQIVHDVRLVLDEAAPRPRIAGAWARPTAGSSPGAAYMTIVNDGTAPDRLVAMRSDCCAAVEIHRTEVDGDRMRMLPVMDGVVVAAGATTAFEPGGYHVMLIEPAEPLTDGSVVDLVAEFEASGPVVVEVDVRASRP